MTETECKRGGLGHRVGCILVYDDAWLDVLINYLVLAWVLAAAARLHIMTERHLAEQHRIADRLRCTVDGGGGTTDGESSAAQRPSPYGGYGTDGVFEPATTSSMASWFDAVVQRRRDRHARCWTQLTALATVLAFQVVLCLILFCSGVSIVWNAVAGFSLGVYRRRGGGTRRALVFQWVVVLATDIYYALTAGYLTSIAHLCAIVLGLLVAQLYKCCSCGDTSGGPRHGLSGGLRLGFAPSDTDSSSSRDIQRSLLLFGGQHPVQQSSDETSMGSATSD